MVRKASNDLEFPFDNVRALINNRNGESGQLENQVTVSTEEGCPMSWNSGDRTKRWVNTGSHFVYETSGRHGCD